MPFLRLASPCTRACLWSMTSGPRTPLSQPRPKQSHEPKLLSQIELTRWSTDFYQAAAELIHACYLGHIDARINDQYRSLHGSLRFLHNIVRFPGCGVFDADASWVLRDRRTGALVGNVALLPRAPATSPTSPSSALRRRTADTALAERSCAIASRHLATFKLRRDHPYRHRGQPSGGQALREPRLLHSASLRRHGLDRQPSPSRSAQPTLFNVIVRGLARDDHVVNMALAQPSVGDANKSGIRLQLRDRPAPQIPHSGA